MRQRTKEMNRHERKLFYRLDRTIAAQAKLVNGCANPVTHDYRARGYFGRNGSIKKKINRLPMDRHFLRITLLRDLTPPVVEKPKRVRKPSVKIGRRDVVLSSNVLVLAQQAEESKPKRVRKAKADTNV